MPITSEEFHARIIDIAVPIRKSLEREWEFAFNAGEVMELLARVWQRTAAYEEVVLALERLVEDGLVESEVIDGGKWYNIAQSETRRRIGFRQES